MARGMSAAMRKEIWRKYEDEDEAGGEGGLSS